MITEFRTPSYLFNCVSLLSIFIICAYQLNEKTTIKTLQETLYLIVVCMAFLTLCTLLYKIRLFVEELFYTKVDYNGDITSVIKATLSFNTPSIIILGVTFFSFMALVMNTNYHVVQMVQLHPVSTFLAIAFSLLLLHSVDILDCRAMKVLRIFSSGGLDPGTAMAGSFFYGYLKIVLPSSGGNDIIGILTALEKYEANNSIKIPVKKLFILIPASSYIPPDLKEISDNWMEHSGTLHTVAIDRAGVKNRTYQNTVYQLRPKGPDVLDANSRPIFLAVEGATPLKTFLEVQDKSHRYAAMYREYNKEIIRNFYTTLQNLLNDNPDCRDYCELVYYEDYVDNKRVNPAHVLLERIARHSET